MEARRAIGLVAWREISERTRDRSFVISIVVFLGLIALFTFLPRLLGGPDRYVLGFADPEGEALAEAARAQATDAEVELRGFDDQGAAVAALERGDVAVVLSGDEVVVDRAAAGRPARPGPARVGAAAGVRGVRGARRHGGRGGRAAQPRPTAGPHAAAGRRS